MFHKIAKKLSIDIIQYLLYVHKLSVPDLSLSFMCATLDANQMCELGWSYFTF